MNKKEFGQLISALRKEQKDENDRQYTQAKLAEITGLSEIIIGKVERGEKENFESDLLLRLADAFRLSSRERKEFFAAAIGVSETQVPHENNLPMEAFETVSETMRNLQVPAFVVDSYGDVITSNAIAYKFFNFSPEDIANAPRIPGGYNIIRLIFSKTSSLYTNWKGRFTQQDWENYLIQNMHLFQAITLKYRATEYYEYLLTSFRKDKTMSLFNMMYYSNRIMGREDCDYFFEKEQHNCAHECLGRISYYTTIAPAITPAGELHLITHLPADCQTMTAFAQLANSSGKNVLHFASWPEKKMA